MLGDMEYVSTWHTLITVATISILLVLGITKCYRISLRPSTNRKCIFALIFALLALGGFIILVAVAARSNLLQQVTLLHTIAFLGIYALSITSVVLGIQGLLEYAQAPRPYNQGRGQVVWSFLISLLMILGTIATFASKSSEEVRHQAFNQTSHPLTVPGRNRTLSFTNFNFTFHAPPSPWVPIKLGKIAKAAQASYMRNEPASYFLIVPELIDNMSRDDYIQLGMAQIQSASTSVHVIRKIPYTVNNLPGVLVEQTAETSAGSLYYVQWYFMTNGFAYKLSGYCSSEDQQSCEDDLRDMLSRFNLINGQRIAATDSAHFRTDFVSPAHYYTVAVSNSAWHEFPSLSKSFPEAEFGGSRGDSCFVVLPLWLRAQKIDPDALASGLLGTMNISYSDDEFTRRQTTLGNGRTQLQLDYRRSVEDKPYNYRLRVIQAGEFGYLVAAWTVLDGEAADDVMNDALGRVNLLPSSPVGNEHRSLFRDRDLNNQETILNQVGLYYLKVQKYEKALPLFQSLVAADGTNTDLISNLLLTWCRLGRNKEGLDFVASEPAEIMKDPQLLSYKAYFLNKCSRDDEAITNYAMVFSGDFRSDDDFKDYINLLLKKRNYDQALAEVQRYSKGADSLNIRLLIPEIYDEKQDYVPAVEFLKAEHEKAPDNSRVTRQLIDTLLDAKLPNDALEFSQTLAKDDPESYQSFYSKARCEIALKWYKEAKSSLETAAKLAPADDDVKSSLDYVSSLLGEGDNSSIKDPIDPVPLPATITNRCALPTATGVITNFGAYYSQFVTALHYGTNSDYKTTDYLRVHIVDQTGVALFSTFQTSFDPLNDDIFVNEARVLDASGKSIAAIKPSDCYVIDEAGDDQVSRRKTLNIPIAGLQPGMDLSLIITRHSGGNHDELPFFHRSFSRTLPVLESGFFLAGPCENLKINVTPGLRSEVVAGGTYWSVTNPMISRWEPLQPPIETFLPNIWIADNRSTWESLATNYLNSIHDELQSDDTVNSKVANLVAGVTNNLIKIEVLSRFVQTNFTYKAIEFGRHSRTPRKAADTLHNTYGDCKDHAVLLQQCLRSSGIPAFLTLVAFDTPLQTNLPSLDQFNHMIVAVPLDDGERYIDCTDKGSDLTANPPVGLEKHHALVLAGDKPRLVQIPDYPASASTIDVSQHAYVVNTNDLTLEETITLKGVHGSGLREYLQGISSAYRQESVQRDFNLEDATMSAFAVSGLDNPSQPLQIKCTLVFKKQFHPTENGLVGSLRSGIERYYLSATPARDRRTPFEIDLPFQLHCQTIFDIPDGYHLVSKGDPSDKLDNRFGTSQTTQELKDNQWRHTLQVQRLSGRFAASDYSAYCETMATILSQTESEMDLLAN